METVENKDVGLVLYTDGGYRGVGGWGVHGYTYTVSEEISKAGKKLNAPTSDGYVDEVDFQRKNATPVKPVNYVDGWGSILGKSTNNVAELKAAIEGFKLSNYYEAQKLTILSDSEYFLKGLTEWSHSWIKNGWVRRDGTDVPNKEHWEVLIDLAKQAKEVGREVRLCWVKGHSDNLGNDLADRNATRGVVLAQKDLDLQNIYHQEAKGYWNAVNEYNRLFAHPNWYFTTNSTSEGKTEDGRYVYHCGQHDNATEMIGKRVSTHAFSVLYLKEPEPVLEKIREYQQKIQNTDYVDIVVGYLNNIMSSNVYSELNEHGCLYVTKTENHNDLYTTEAKQLTWQARPPKLAQRCITTLNFVEGLLQEYISSDHKTITLTDLTPYFYDQEETKKKVIFKLKKSIGTSAKSVDVMGNYNVTGEVKVIPITLTFNLDLPSRNGLSALAGPDTKLTLLTYRESDHGFRYCVVVENKDDIGIFNSVHSNLKVLSEP